jgi:hypothetical protein
LTAIRYAPSFPLSKHLPLPADVQLLILHPVDPTLMFGSWTRLVWVELNLEGGRFSNGEAFQDCRPKGRAFNLMDIVGS